MPACAVAPSPLLKSSGALSPVPSPSAILHGDLLQGPGGADPSGHPQAKGDAMKTVAILGAGFAGLELATRLSEDLPEEVDVTLIDSSDAFVFGYSKLDVMFGRDELDQVRIPYSKLHKPAVRFVRETVESIDPERRRVTTNASTYEPDILVVALDADLDPAATPGLVDEGSEYYSVAGAERVGRRLPVFEGGNVIIGVLGPFFKCPAAPLRPLSCCITTSNNVVGWRPPRSRSSAPCPLPSPSHPKPRPASCERSKNVTSDGGPSRR